MPPKVASGRGRKRAIQKEAQNGIGNSDGVALNSTEDKVKDKVTKDQSSELNNLVLNEAAEVNLNGEVSDTLTNDKSKGTEKIADNQETKRGRKRGKVNIEENGTIVVGKDENLKATASVDPAPKRGRKKANNVNSAKTVDSSEKLENVAEHLSAKIDESELNDGAKSELKGNNLASNEPIEREESPEKNDAENHKPEGGETDTVSNCEDFKQVPSTEVVPKRGRKKADIKEGSSTISQSEGASNSETSSQKTLANDTKDEEMEDPSEKEQKTVKSKSGSKTSKSSTIKGSAESTDLTDTTKKSRAGRNKKQTEVSSVKETSRVDRKRKNVEKEPLVEEIKKNKSKESELEHSDIVEKTRALKVALTRSESIDNLLVEKTEKYKELGKTGKSSASKPAAKGKRAKADNADGSDSGAKPAKIPKETKGQSKKDKMPDVTLQNFDNTSTSPSGKPWNLKISSWNVNGVRAWLEKDGLTYLKHESPDIMCLQETKCSDDNLPEEIVNVAGYHSYFLAAKQEGYSGVGLLTKEKPISVKYGIGIDEHSDEGRTITAEYENFYLVTSYVPNAGRKLVRLDYRQQWDKDFRSYLKNLDGEKPVVLCGDLNVAHEEIDLANPKTNKKNAGFTKEEREGFSVLLSEGFIDTFRHLYPDQKGAYTFWTYMMNARAKDVGWRLDYFVISKRLIDNLCDNVIRKDVFGSDHCPITLFLSF